MASEVLTKYGDQWCFCVSGSLSPADSATDMRIGTPTNVDCTMSGIADGAGRQSAKMDFSEKWGNEIVVHAAFDFTGETPTTAEVVELYFAGSPSSTAAQGNVAGNSGADAAAPGGALGSITLAEMVKQCQFIGTFVVHDGGVVQNGYVGRFIPEHRYGQLIVKNESGDAFEADNVEHHVTFTELIYEAQ